MSGSSEHGGGGESRPRAETDSSFVLHEEEATADKRWEGVGHLRVRREVEHGRVSADYPRRVEELAYEHVPVAEGDSGQIETLPDGSISIPLFEEELVVTRKTVLRERVIIRKEIATEWQTVSEELRRERVSLETDDVPEGSVEGAEALEADLADAAPREPRRE